MNTPCVSVIIPTYNHVDFLPHAIQSVLDQTYQDFEIIIVDDGSTDNTRAMVMEIQDARLRYVYQTNRGLAAARNKGLSLAQGEFVAFLDADDLFLPAKLASQVKLLRARPELGLVLGGWKFIDERGTFIGEYQPWPNPPELNIESWLWACRTTVSSVLVKREWVERVGGFDESLRQVEDWDLWLRLVYAGCQMDWVDAFVDCYRFSSGQMTRNAAMQKKSGIQTLDKFFAQPDIPPELIARRAVFYSHLYRVSAGREYAAGQLDDARESIEIAMRYSPELVDLWRDDQVHELLAAMYHPGFSEDPLDYVCRVFDNLPASAQSLKARKRWALGEYGLRIFFSAHRAKDWFRVRRMAWIVVQNAPHRLLNRGILAIVFKSLRYSSISNPLPPTSHP